MHALDDRRMAGRLLLQCILNFSFAPLTAIESYGGSKIGGGTTIVAIAYSQHKVSGSRAPLPKTRIEDEAYEPSPI